ncbi:MAG: polysaccharide biosynthesis protein [Spirochaetes bacterium]|nr:polysaccharide biosynthesis protein [Spirochaetota bacterium]
MKEPKRILLIGAGEAGTLILSEFSKRSKDDCIAGFLDDDTKKIGTLISGKPVLASTDDAVKIIEEQSIDEVIITIPSASADKIERIIAGILKKSAIKISVLPSSAKYFDSGLMSDLSEVSFADITGRKEVQLDIESMNSEISGKTVLVTGAGGSIGSEICKNLLRFSVKKIICIGRGENSIYELENILKNTSPDSSAEIIYRICDVRNFDYLKSLFNLYKPDIVFHAAAHKHVPIMEINEAEACANNIGGTRNVLEACLCVKAKLVLVSTDKAVYPSSFMGSTKRICEMLTLYYNKRFNMNVSAVRFGNVLGSRGSVIRLFKDQIQNGGPVTVTDKNMKRYFMSIPEAALLVINASSYSSGGEIFMLEMGQQYYINDIAIKMISLLTDKEIEIRYTGLRKGEKLEEKLNYDFEKIHDTKNPKIKSMTADRNYNFTQLEDFMNNSLPAIYSFDAMEIRKKVESIINSFNI